MPELFSDEALTQPVRDAIHAFALNAREVLTREAHDLLEGVYGLHSDGLLEEQENLPALKESEARKTYERLKRFIKDETQAGLGAEEAVTKLVKEIAFTHLNRLVAFKMLESSKLIREAVGRGMESNGFKFYLADHSEDEAQWKAGHAERAYANFLRWQAGEIAREVPMLFDPDDLPSHLFPRMTILNQVLADLNSAELQAAWSAEETIGWVYQFFNERENSDVFDRLFKQKKKIRREDIPAATQRFTPRWIVRYLVENTLGRLWMQMHPDSRLGAEMRYLVPTAAGMPAEKLRPVKEISLLDPACGTMHFGLVAFDLFAEMYREEFQRAGMPGWLDQASVKDEAEIPSAILAHNLFGIDIDLRATQLSALTLYIKAKRTDRKSQLTVHNLACADVLPFSTADLARFLVEMRFTNPIFEKMLRRIREQLVDIQQVGSLLRIERELQNLVGEQRRKDTQKRKAKYGDASEQPALLSMDEQTALDAEHYSLLEAQLIQSLDFFRQQVAGQGEDLRFFTGEAAKSLRVLDLLLRRYDVVLANPPYLSRRSMNDEMAAFLDEHYPEAKGDLYAAFIARCAELTEEFGRVGMITQQSFMFISSYETLRTGLLETFAVETMAHTGAHAFPEIQGEKVNTTAFTLRREADATRRAQNTGTYFRLVHEKDADAKRVAFERAVEDMTSSLPVKVYCLPQKDFEAIPGKPWVYWVSSNIRQLFSKLPNLSDVALPRQGAATSDNFRFLRFWWEVGLDSVNQTSKSLNDAQLSMSKWFPYMKGGDNNRWYGNQENVVNWLNDGLEMKALANEKRRKYSPNATGDLWSAWLNSTDYYFHEGITYSYLSSDNFSVRYLPNGFIFDVAGSAVFPNGINQIYKILAIMNSQWCKFALRLINPTVNFQIGDVKRLPVTTKDFSDVSGVLKSIYVQFFLQSMDEKSFNYVVPFPWQGGLEKIDEKYSSLNVIELNINREVYNLYDISSEEQFAIDIDLTGNAITEIENDAEEEQNDDEEFTSENITTEEFSARWVSYAIGVVLGRFTIGSKEQSLGCAVYRREDFAIGSLPTPSVEEFNELVGTPETFAYIDEQGGRHIFPREVEKSLRALAFEDGISVLEEGHPRDLAARVEKALVLMLGEQGTSEVIQTLGGEASGVQAFLRQFLGKDYFTKWHFKWYRKRPIYWAIQSAKRSYGFVIFHEKITRDTFYAIQRDPYLDTKRNAVSLKMGDLQGSMSTATGSTRKRLEKELDGLQKVSAELEEFSKELESITMGGYNPAPEWIDDGVILRMAPLWKVIPIWKAEPKKYWERLEAGDFDWSRIAMNYWADRVKAKCKVNKSYAIAHGHEEWYEA